MFCYYIVNIVTYMRELNAELLDYAIATQTVQQECGMQWLISCTG